MHGRSAGRKHKKTTPTRFKVTKYYASVKLLTNVLSIYFHLDRRGGVVVRAFASRSVDQASKTCLVMQKSLKNGSTASLLRPQHKKDSVEENPARTLVVSLEKALNGIPPSLRGRQVGAEQLSRHGGDQSDQRHANRERAQTHKKLPLVRIRYKENSNVRCPSEGHSNALTVSFERIIILA